MRTSGKLLAILLLTSTAHAQTLSSNGLASIIPTVVTAGVPIYSNTVTPFDTGVGLNSCSLATGTNNTCIGYNAGPAIAGANSSTCIGPGSCGGLTSGSNSTAVGQNAFHTGNSASVTAIGAGSIAGGANTTVVGYAAASNSASATVLGANVVSNVATSIAIGTGDGTVRLDYAKTNAGQWTVTGMFLSAGTVPTIASGACGASTNGTIAGTNNSGVITIGASATTTCVVTFAATVTTAPNSCVFSPMNAAAAVQLATVASGVFVTQQTNVGFTLTGAVMASTVWSYHCM